MSSTEPPATVGDPPEPSSNAGTQSEAAAAAVEAQPEPVSLQPEDSEQGDVDSALGDERSALTQSLRSSLRESVQENGRGYHRYKSISGEDYVIPDDEAEQDRLDLQHEMFLYTFDGKLYNSPLEKDKVKEVLDLGTGTGIWAIDFADEHPSAQVIGTDLSPIQPAYVPPNLKFEIDDMNEEWTFSQKFDFIHARGLCGASKDFQRLIAQGFKHLAPGGWMEMPEVYVPWPGIDDTVKGTKLEEWSVKQVEACATVGMDTTACSKYKQWMIDAGFENVTEIKFKWPIGTWPKDKKAKQLGKMCLLNTLIGIEAFTLRLWTGVLGMSYEQVQVDLAAIRSECKNPKIHAYWPMYSVFGQKPKTA